MMTMTKSATFLALMTVSAAISATNAFLPDTSFLGSVSHARISPSLRMNDEPMAVADPMMEATLAPVASPVAPTTVLPKMSQSLPFMMRPPMLDGSMAGDVGFDPFGFAKNKEDLMNYREAEIKHARLAMLAAAGWPLSELFDRKIANLLNLPALVVVEGVDDRAPSLLNGGLGKISPVYWIAVLVAGAAIDVYGITKARSNDPAYFPGKLGFDPLGVYPKSPEGQMRMQTTEIKNGRLAMIAITAFAVQEFVYKYSVVNETPVFFKPLGQVLSEYTNSGYISH